MSSRMRVEVARDLDEDTGEAMKLGSTLVVQITPARNRAPTGLIALQVPAQVCERIWEELETLHKKTFS